MSISNSPLPPFHYHTSLPFSPPLSGASFYPAPIYPTHLSPSLAGTPPASSATPTSAYAATPSLVFAVSSGGNALQNAPGSNTGIASVAVPPTTSTMSGTPAALNVALMNPMLALATQKDSRWLTLEVCREFQRNKCSRTENECKFAHPPPQVEVQNGRVTACFDSIKGKCQRKDPPCKYLHPPQHLREQLLANGRNNLILKNTAAMLAAQQAAQVAQVPYHQAAIISAAAGMQPQVSMTAASSIPMFSNQGSMLAPHTQLSQFNPYLSSAPHGATALPLHRNVLGIFNHYLPSLSAKESALVAAHPSHAHQSSTQPTTGAAQGFSHQQPQGQTNGSTAQHQLVQQQINVIPSPAIVNAQKLQRTDRLEPNRETNPHEAAMAVAQKAALAAAAENSCHNVIPLTHMGNNLTRTHAAAHLSPRPTSAPPTSTEPIKQESVALNWNQIVHGGLVTSQESNSSLVPNSSSEMPKTFQQSEASSSTAQLSTATPCIAGKKRPCDPMSDVITSVSQGCVPGNQGPYTTNPMSTAVTFSASTLQHHMAAAAAAANISQQHHHPNAAVIQQASLLSNQQPLMHNTMPCLGHPLAKRPALADAKSGVPVYPQPAAAANSASYQQAAALAAMQLQQSAATAQQNAFVPVSFTGHPPGLPRF